MLITDSANPVAVAVNGESFNVPVVSLASNLVLDSNGAGDSFAGGFFAQLCLNPDDIT